MERRIITTDVTEEEKVIETNLRPQMLKDYIGQEKIKAKEIEKLNKQKNKEKKKQQQTKAPQYGKKKKKK